MSSSNKPYLKAFIKSVKERKEEKKEEVKEEKKQTAEEIASKKALELLEKARAFYKRRSPSHFFQLKKLGLYVPKKKEKKTPEELKKTQEECSKRSCQKKTEQNRIKKLSWNTRFSYTKK